MVFVKLKCILLVAMGYAMYYGVRVAGYDRIYRFCHQRNVEYFCFR